MPPAMLGQKHLRRDNKTLILDIIGLQRYSFYSEYQIVHRFFMPNLEKFPTSASHAIRTSTPNQHAQREKPPKCGCRNAENHRHIGIVAERRHFSVTRYAERSGCVPGFCASFTSRVPEVRHYLWRDG